MLSAHVSGVDQLAADVRDAVAQLAALDHGPAADLLTTTARPGTPVRTGALRDTVRAEITPAGPVLTAGSPLVDYAPFVHARTPWLADAVTARERAVVDTYSAQVADVVRGTFGR